MSEPELVEGESNGNVQRQGYFLFEFEKVLAYKSLKTNRFVSTSQGGGRNLSMEKKVKIASYKE